MKTLFKSEEGKKKIFDLYDAKLNSLNIDYEYETVNTKFGKTNVIVTGDSTKPPMILVHGSNGSAPVALETYQNLHKKYRLYAVDVLAQPNKSEGTLLSMKDDSYGIWMNEIIDHFKFDSVEMAGFSFGGLVILKTLEFDESKVKEVYLSAPAYIVNGNQISALFKMFIPMKKYMKTEKQKYLEKFLAEIFTQKDAFATNQLSVVFLEFEMDFTPVPVIDSEQAKKIKTPITIFAAQNDILFPGQKMLKRASKIFPSLKDTVLLEDSKHVQNSEHNRLIEKVIMQ